MRKIILFMLMFSGLLTGCQLESEELSIKEVGMSDISKRATEFFEGIEMHKMEKGNGIYIFNESENSRYIYLNQDFLEPGKMFGEADILHNEDSLEIYLSDKDETEEELEQYKIYEIKQYEEYEYLRIFKNNEETYFHIIGL